MSTSPQLAATDSQPGPAPTTAPSENPAGGPRTPEGRAISSRNATTFGLYAARDFVRPNEKSGYRDLGEQLRTELAPIGLLEDNLVDEIRRAMWRLGRCGEVEQSFVTAHADPTSIPDPMRPETQAKLQLSVDRARALYQRLLHKCTAELRKLQTERQLRNESFDAGTDLSQFGLCDWAFISKDLNRQTISDYRTDMLQTRAHVDAIFAPPAPSTAQPGSFCKTPRNAQCPCGSGQKHKRCCGKNAPPLLKAA
jgi:hypothetical protein